MKHARDILITNLRNFAVNVTDINITNIIG